MSVAYTLTVTNTLTVRENQRMSMRDLEVLSSIDPITTSTGDSDKSDSETAAMRVRARTSSFAHCNHQDCVIKILLL